jgi:hypothetical protein
MALYGTLPSDEYEAVLVATVNDCGLYEVVRAAGFVPFGRPEDGSYDPVCFDTRQTVAECDYPVVRMDHEAALCNSRATVMYTVASSFRELIIRHLDGG